MDARPLVASIVSFVASPNRVYVDEEVTFYLNATSTDPMATVQVTIYFDYYLSDGVTVNPESPVFSTEVAGSPANVVTTFSYGHVGNLTDAQGTYFQCRAFVDDGDMTTPAQRSVRAYVVENTPPFVESKPPSTIIIDEYGTEYNMSYLVKDWDSEVVTVVWDFGDGTEHAVNETYATPAGSYVRQSHVWLVDLEPGRESYYVYLNMSVSFTDSHGHLVYSNHTVRIKTPDNLAPSVTFWAKSTSWSPGFELPFYACVTDPEGDPITWTFVFNNSYEDYLTEVYHSDETEPLTTVWNNVTHTFDEVGTYSVTLYVSDALPPYQTRFHNLSQKLPITVSENRPPGVLANISVPQVIPRINTTLGYAEVTFSIEANDPDGDVLFLTWDFGDGGTATNESLGGTRPYEFVQVHRFTDPGLYNVSVVVDDMRGHEVLRFRLVSILTNNSAPELIAFDFQLSNRLFAVPNSTVNLTITISDRERDPLTVWVDFGDNTTVVRLELTEYADDNTVTAVISHVYNSTGRYSVIVTYTDGVFGHQNKSLTMFVDVRVPRESSVRYWDAWDYLTLALVNAVIAIIMIRWVLLGRFRKELDKKAMTLEEYKMMVKELKSRRSSAMAGVAARVKDGKLDSAAAKRLKAEIHKDYLKRVDDLRAGRPVELDDGV